MVDKDESVAATDVDDAEQPDRPRRSRRRLLLAGAAGAVAGAFVRGNQPVAATGGAGDQGALLLGSNDFLIAPNNPNNDAAVSSVATVIKASPNFGNFSSVAGNHVFKADASTATGTINGIEGVGTGSGAGVRGTSANGYGVFATGTYGVYAQGSGTGGGSYGVAIDGIGVQGSSQTSLGGSFSGGRAALRLVPNGGTGAPTTGQHSAGELWVDGAGILFMCKTAGTPGTWVKVTEQATGGAAAPSFQTLPTPERFIDTRSALGGTQGPVSAGTTSTFQMTGRNGESGNATLQIPAAATAIVGNLSVIASPSAPIGSFVTMWPSGDRPTTSSISFGPGAIVANAYTVGLGPGTGAQAGQKIITVFAQQTCDYIVDVVGFYA
jgi:hypothetical protein